MMTTSWKQQLLSLSSISAKANSALTLLIILLLYPLHSHGAAGIIASLSFSSLSAASTSSSLALFSQPASSLSSSPLRASSSCGQLLRREHHQLTGTLLMSCIPDDNDTSTDDGEDGGNNTFLFPFEINLPLFLRPTLPPPPPEDPIALSGDMLALFVYSYMDHTINEMLLYAQSSTTGVGSIRSSILIHSGGSSSSAAVQSMDASAPLAILASSGGPIAAAASASGLLPPLQPPPQPTTLPVWFDAAHLQTYGSNWLAVSRVDAPYAPAIAPSGLAFVCIATSWLLCGHVSGAFLRRNTIECPPSRAMIVTLRAWMGTAALMVLAALGSDGMWSALDAINALSPQARGGLTRADADYIFDSLSVLGCWRFVLNWFLGYYRR